MVPMPGTSFHSVCQPGTPRVSSSWRRESRRRFGGGDDRLGALYRLVDGVQHGGDGPLLRQGREEKGKSGWTRRST